MFNRKFEPVLISHQIRFFQNSFKRPEQNFLICFFRSKTTKFERKYFIRIKNKIKTADRFIFAIHQSCQFCHFLTIFLQSRVFLNKDSEFRTLLKLHGPMVTLGTKLKSVEMFG